MRILLCLAVILSASIAFGCPLVVVPSVSTVATVGVQSVAVVQPQVAVQSFALAVPQVQVQTFAIQPAVVQAQAVSLLAAPVCAKGACYQRAQRAGILSRILGSRSRSVSRAVSVQR